MEKYLPVIEKCSLFRGIKDTELRALLACLKVSVKCYAKNSFIFMAEDTVAAIGIVLSGSVHIIREDFWGARNILAHIASGGLFGEAFTCAGVQRLPVSALAAQSSEILLLDYRRVITSCSSACAFHTVLIHNMLRILADKNVLLTQKMEYLTRHTIREKLLTYLSDQASRAASAAFTIPFNRQELAEYLAVDRSALSHELSKMRNEGIVRYQRNRFELL